MSDGRAAMGAVRSMTGFAAVDVPFAEGTLMIEVRSVNHRHLDLAVHLRGLQRSLEGGLREVCRQRLRRGRVELSLRWTAGSDAGAHGRRIDRAAARALLREAAELEGDQDTPGTALRDILALPGIVAAELPPLELDAELQAGLSQAVDRVVSLLDDQRATEGARLLEVIRRDLNLLDAVVAEISLGAEQRAAAVGRRITERLQRVLADWRRNGAGAEGEGDCLEALDEELRSRVVQEAAMVADRQDTTEEVDRLRAHLAQLRSILDGDLLSHRAGPPGAEAGLSIGKRLEFLLQEVLRELNTVASKCRDAEVAQLVVSGKTLNERLREQVLNLE